MVFYFIFIKGSAAALGDMRILCLLFLFVLALVFPLFSFSFVDKGRILSNLLTLSGALLSCSHHESFCAKFTCLLFFYTVVYLCFALGFPVSLCYPWTRWRTFSACLFVATGYRDHFFFLSFLFEQRAIIEKVHHVSLRERNKPQFSSR